MKSARPHAFSGVLILFAFACLLLAGSQRLIASSDKPKDFADLSGREAWFCAVPTAAQEQLPEGQSVSRASSEKRAAVPSERWNRQAGRLVARCDANGNVLSGNGRYMKAVYRAFPLGDGFA